MIAEKSVFDTLKRNKFIPNVVGEECGLVKGNDVGLIVMDGIDGTTNANCGLPFYCCSLAYASNTKLESITDAVVFNLLTGIFIMHQKIKAHLLMKKN